MVGLIFYLFGIILEILFAAGFTAVTVSFIYSSFKGSPYVPTRKKVIDQILKSAHLKKNQLFYELGCGDGRVSGMAAQKYGVKAIGIDINPLLVWYANLIAKIKKVKNVEFIKKNISDVNFSHADVLYIFLMPKLISRMIPKFENELKKNTLVISHGFKIVEWNKKLISKIDAVPFPTYYYRK